MLSPPFVEPEPAAQPHDTRRPHPTGEPGSRGLDRSLLALALALATWLAFANLSSQVLWQDEAQSALLARTALSHGVPLGTDGRNFFSQELGAEYDEAYRWRWHTWLHFYLVAGSFALFGESTASARWPGALMGVLTVLAVYGLAREWWRDRFAAHGAMAALLSLVPFWVLTRQCRYYSLTALLSVGALLGYTRLVRGRRGGGALYVGALFGLFHAHYVYVPPLLAATALHAAVAQRDALRPVLIAASGVLALCAPWIVWQSGMDYGRHYASQLWEPALWLANGDWFVRSLLGWLSGLAGLVAVVAVGAAVALRSGAGELRRLLRDDGLRMLAFAMVAVLAVVSVVAPGPFFRYLAPLVPLVALGFGGLAAIAFRLHPLAGVAVLLGVAALQPIGSFVEELTHEFDGPIEGLVEYLSAQARPGDVLWITYGDLPFKFYTNLRVLGGLTGEDLAVALEREPPDWLVLRENVVHAERDGRVADFIRREVDLSEFQKIELPYTDTTFENREDPAEHRFRPARGGPPVAVFRRNGG